MSISELVSKTSQKTLNMFLGQPCCICIKENKFDVKGFKTDVAGIIENKIHFLCECKKYSTLRLKLYDSIECTYFTYFVLNANSEEMFIHLM